MAEDMIFGPEQVTSGAQSDIEQATRLARMMVTRWGFSPELGTVAYGENQDEVFLGMSVARQQNVSEATAQTIDSEARRLVEEGLNEARRILTEKQADLETLAQGLLEYETLSGDEIHGLLDGRPPIRDTGEPPPPARPSPGPPPRRAPASGEALAGAVRGPRPPARDGRRSGAAAAGMSPRRPSRSSAQ